MLVRSLILRHFRNYTEAAVDFGPRVNVLCGANAQGKTSLLEAIFLCVSGRSFRLAQTVDLQQVGCPFFGVEVYFVKNGVEQRLKYLHDGESRKITYNSTTCHSIAQLLGIIPGVVMTPDDSVLVKGGPAQRRHFLDLQMAQANPLYLHHLARYQKAMRQRNHLLKQRSAVSIEAWEQEMAISAAYIAEQRHIAIEDLAVRASSFYQRLSLEQERLSLKYKTSAPANQSQDVITNYYLERFRQNRQRDMELGWTASGPHKDDLLLAIEGKAGRFYASEGQQRCCVTALRLAEWERLRDQSGHRPLLVIDDVAISLDDDRRRRLMKMLAGFGQVFLSSAQDLKGQIGVEETKFFKVQQGQVTVREEF